MVSIRLTYRANYMNIDLTTVVSSAVIASILSVSQFLATRYVGRALDSIEKVLKVSKRKTK